MLEHDNYYLYGLHLDKYLTKIEMEVLKLLYKGLSVKYIASDLMKSPRTVEKQIENIRNKVFDRNIEKIFNLNPVSIFKKN